MDTERFFLLLLLTSFIGVRLNSVRFTNFFIQVNCCEPSDWLTLADSQKNTGTTIHFNINNHNRHHEMPMHKAYISLLIIWAYYVTF